LTTRNWEQFLVTWKGYGSEADEWVLLSKLENCMDMVTAFKQQHGLIFKRERSNSTVTPCDPHLRKFILYLVSRKNIQNLFLFAICTCS